MGRSSQRTARAQHTDAVNENGREWVCLSRERDSGENVTPGHAQQFHREYAEYQ